MIRRLLILSVFLILLGCEVPDEVKAVDANLGSTKVWASIQLDLAAHNEESDYYYYYAKISENLFKKMSANNIRSGFILLENVRYWGEDDLLYSYRDIESTGDILFRIEDVVKIELVRTEPIIGLGFDQFDEPTSEGEPADAPEVDENVGVDE